MFSPQLIDGMEAHLRSFGDADLRSRAEADTKLMEKLVAEHFHCG